jgi:Glycosyl hydrolase family 26
VAGGPFSYRSPAAYVSLDGLLRPSVLAARPARCLLGAHASARFGQTHEQAMTAMESDLGRRFAIDHVYHGWQHPLIGPYERWSAAHGHTLLIGWKAVLEWPGGSSNGSGAGWVPWADIAAGKQDDVIVAQARLIKSFGRLVYLNFHHEPEDDATSPGHPGEGTPADYRAAWRHIHEVFERQHVTNVRFVWTLMGWTFRRGLAGQWYPGDDVLDVVSADAYNWYGTGPARTGWTTFENAFDASYRFAVRRSKPFWVTETGTMEDPSNPDRKAAWYRAMADQAAAWPEMQALVLFTGGVNGWYPDSSRAALLAFRALAHDPQFG